MLTNFKVLELASVLAGPGVGQFFAELGAEVIKVENVNCAGDVTRSWKIAGENTDDRSAYFCAVNWGKKSIAIDLNSREGLTIIHQLVAKTDLVIASYKPGDAEKLGVDYNTLSAINPALIYGQITGYGSGNPRVGYDAVIQAEAGFMYMNGEPGGPALKMPVALIDILAAHQLKEAILLALLEKTKTGQGKCVEVSLLHVAISSLANQASNWLVANKLPEKQGSTHPNIAPYGDVFTTKDHQQLLLAIGSDKQFQDLCKALPIDLSKDTRFTTNQRRVENRSILNKTLAVAFRQEMLSDVLSRIHQAKIPAGVIQNLQQVFAMPEARALLIAADGLLGVKTFVAGNFSATGPHLLPPPHFGQHTVEILTEKLLYSPENIKTLQQNHTIF
jgi:crotonobetainyl-CoA:carnitine CoA-transferase CaiB-like acyl-CoA transferase